MHDVNLWRRIEIGQFCEVVTSRLMFWLAMLHILVIRGCFLRSTATMMDCHERNTTEILYKTLHVCMSSERSAYSTAFGAFFSR